MTEITMNLSPYRVCEQAMVFTLGLMLHEMLTGEVPFGEMNPSEAAKRIGIGERPSVGGIDGNGMVEAMTRMWSADVKERPSLSEVVEWMGKIVDG